MPNDAPEGYELRYTEGDNLPYYQKIADIPSEPSDDLNNDPFARAAARMRHSVVHDRLPVQGRLAPETPSPYLMGPDLLEAQQGQSLPTDTAVNDAGIPFNLKTGAEIQTVRRPNVLPVAMTPEGPKWAMPKMLDLAGNIMGGVAGVPAKAGEVVLGSGVVRKMAEEATGPFFSSLERAVDSAKIGKADAQQWLGYLKNQPGVKAEEINTVLGDLKGALSKSEVQDIIKTNKVELGEVVKGKNNSMSREQFDNLSEIEQNRLAETSDQATKYHSYQLPGGENYKEMLLTLPQKTGQKPIIEKGHFGQYQVSYPDGNFEGGYTLAEAQQAAKEFDLTSKHAIEAPIFKSSHWDEPNIVAHIRMNDRIVEGKKVLHLEELQSDWGQAIRKSGYKLDPKEKEALEATAKSVDDKLIAAKRDDIMGNPNLKAGLDTAVKDKLITDKEAKDYLKLTDNENSTIPDMPFKKSWAQLAIKRMIHKAASEGRDAITWTPGEAQASRYDLNKQIDRIAYNPDTGYFKAIDKTGKDISTGPVPKEKLADTIGKEAAEKLLKTEPNNLGIHSLENADLKIGGEGMKGFYDTIIRNEFNNIGKKYGAKVEKRGLSTAMKERSGPLPEGEISNRVPQDVHYFPITQALKEKALKEGFELFSSAPTLYPISHNPFASEDQKRYKLTPVSGNPFEE